MRIFIGCTENHLVGAKKLNELNIKNQKSVAFLLAKKLNQKTPHTVMPWWEKETISDNADFFQRIQDLTEICEFGIFIFSKKNVKPAKSAKNGHSIPPAAD